MSAETQSDPCYDEQPINGQYQVLELLGQGATSHVHRARDINLDRDVACKIFFRQLALSAVHKERFKREARTLARLKHPNIVKLFDWQPNHDPMFMIMELIEGDTLEKRIRARRLTVNEALGILLPIASALAYAHSEELIHRDIKPQNILMGTDGEPRLTDFGIAYDSSMASLTMTNEVIGTAAYLSPQRCKGFAPVASDDIYSFGITLYKCLAGTCPYSGDPATVMHKHIHDPVPDVRLVDPNIPLKLSSVIQKCLAKERSERYGSVQDLVADLAGLVGDEPANPPATGAWTPLTPREEAPTTPRESIEPTEVIEHPTDETTNDLRVDLTGRRDAIPFKQLLFDFYVWILSPSNFALACCGAVTVGILAGLIVGQILIG